MDVPEIRFIEGQFSRVSLDEKDIIIISHQEHLSMNELEILKTKATEAFPGLHIIILDGGLTIGALTPQGVKKE